jgi:two-component system cell cycle response regulator DivK
MKTILVADDRPASLELIRAVLDDLGYKVLEAQNGADAVRQARESNPDLVLLDLHMPVLDGFGALAELRADAAMQDVPIVALTASGMAGDRERALAAGFSDYLSKPISLARLRSEVERYLRG